VQENDRRIISIKQSTEIAGVSLGTWVRMKARGETPPAVHVSPHRIGYMLCDLYAWLESRKETAA
jgi:predicted DNA-binding transcriptional regulator AlpA